MTPHPDLLRLNEPPLLCHPVRDYAGRMPDGDLLVDVKYDGVRALWVDGELVTRQGLAIGGVEHLAEALRRLEHRYGRKMFFDGEMVIGGSFDATARHCAFWRQVPDEPDARIYLFDALPVDDWKGGHPTTPILCRRMQLVDMVQRLDDPAIVPVVGRTFDDPARVEAYAAGVIVDGHEGIVIKPQQSRYSRTRQGAWLRIKRMVTIDCRIMGTTPHPDSPEMLGALIVDAEGHRLKVARGFTDDERRRLWRERAIITNRHVEVEAMERTKAGKLRQPRFARIRWERIWDDR